MGKVYVVFRPQDDSVRREDGSFYVDSIRGQIVRPDVGQYGGIILRQIRVSNPVITESRTYINGYDEDGDPIIVDERIPHERKVIKKVKGQDGKSWTYICEPCEYDAVYFAGLREGWTWLAFDDESQIPRNSQVAVKPEADQEKEAENVDGTTDRTDSEEDRGASIIEKSGVRAP